MYSIKPIFFVMVIISACALAIVPITAFGNSPIIQQSEKIEVKSPDGSTLWSADVPTKISISEEDRFVKLEIPFKATPIGISVQTYVQVELWNARGKQITRAFVSDWNPSGGTTLEELTLYTDEDIFGNSNLIFTTCFTTNRSVCLSSKTQTKLQISTFSPLETIDLKCSWNNLGTHYQWNSPTNLNEVEKIEIGLSHLIDVKSDPSLTENYSEYEVWDSARPNGSNDYTLTDESIFEWMMENGINKDASILVAVRPVNSFVAGDWGRGCFTRLKDIVTRLVPPTPKIEKTTFSNRVLKLSMDSQSFLYSFELGVSRIKNRSSAPTKISSFYTPVKVRDFDGKAEQRVSSSILCKEINNLTEGVRDVFMVSVRASNKFGVSKWSKGVIIQYKKTCN